jgi:hypothetical protein
VDTTIVPPSGVVDVAVRPCSLRSLGSVLADTFCPECDRDVSEPAAHGVTVRCARCSGAAPH